MTISPYTKSNIERKISLPPKIIKILSDYREGELKNKNEWKESYNDNNLMFCYENGNCLDIMVLPSLLRKIVKRAGIRELKFHALRHTFATRVLEAKVPVKAVSQILGRANISITLDTYSHVLPEFQDEAMQMITDKFLLEA